MASRAKKRKAPLAIEESSSDESEFEYKEDEEEESDDEESIDADTEESESDEESVGDIDEIANNVCAIYVFLDINLIIINLINRLI